MVEPQWGERSVPRKDDSTAHGMGGRLQFKTKCSRWSAGRAIPVNTFTHPHGCLKGDPGSMFQAKGNPWSTRGEHASSAFSFGMPNPDRGLCPSRNPPALVAAPGGGYFRFRNLTKRSFRACWCPAFPLFSRVPAHSRKFSRKCSQNGLTGRGGAI